MANPPSGGSAGQRPCTYEDGVRDGMGAASMLLDLSSQDILLAAGEMTRQELLSVKAVLAWRKGVIRRKAGLD